MTHPSSPPRATRRTLRLIVAETADDVFFRHGGAEAGTVPSQAPSDVVSAS